MGPRRGRPAEAPLEFSEPGEQLVEREQGRAPGKPHEGHLERHAHLPALDDVVEGLREPLEEAREVVELGAAREIDHVAHFLVGQIEQVAQGRAAVGRVRRTDLRDHEVAQVPQQIARRVSDVVALLGYALDDVQARGRVAAYERRRQLVHDGAIGDPEHPRDVLSRELVAAERDDLVEEAHRVAHRAGGLASQDLHTARRRLDLLEGEHLVEPSRDGLRRYQLEVVPLAAGEDGDRDLLDLGRREDELHVRRRLLERLEERVPRRRRQHVDLVDHVDLEPVARGAEAHALLEAPHLVDAVVAGAVDLLHVEVLPRGDLPCRENTALHGVAVGPVRVPDGPTQLRQLASSRALVVFPTPRTPVKRNACATRPDAMAFASVRATCSWPTRSSND